MSLKTVSGNSIYRSAAGVVLASAFILLLPLLAMQFTDEVVWDLTDFIVAGALLVSTGFTYKLTVARAGNTAYRMAVGVALFTALLIVWINLAVGIVGIEGNPANLMYFGVVAFGVIGVFLARFQPLLVGYAMFATALVQAAVAVITLWGGYGSIGIVLGLNMLLIALWTLAAWLFRKGSQSRPFLV